MRVLISVLSLLPGASALAAQLPISFGLQGAGTLARVHGLATSAQPWEGRLLGGRASAALGPVQLSMTYVQGRITAANAVEQPVLVDGGVAVDVRVFPWVTIGVGPHTRSYEVNRTIGRRYWVAGHLGVDAPLVGGGSLVRTHIGLWRALAVWTRSDVAWPTVATWARDESLEQVTGGVVGLTVGVPRSWGQWWMRLETSFDRAQFRTRRENTVGLTITAGWGR